MGVDMWREKGRREATEKDIEVSTDVVPSLFSIPFLR